MESDVRSIWTEGLDLLDSALGMLSDANLRPGKDDSLIVRGNLLRLGHAHSRLGLEGLEAELIPPACRLIRDQLTMWRQMAVIRLCPGDAPGTGTPRGLKKRLRKAIEQSGGALDAELVELARDGLAALRALPGGSSDPSQGFRRAATRDGSALGIRWGLVALGLLLHEARELGLMTGEWRNRVANWEDSLGCWLQAPNEQGQLDASPVT